MDISVIICTYNRALSLPRALTSVAWQRFAQPVKWEVVVVDNNSRDETRAVAAQFSAQHPGRFRYIFEAVPGKSNALNTGIRESFGNLIAFMDDDVIVDPNWLANLTSVLKDSPWAGVGGRVLLDWSSPPPRWLSMKRPYSLAGVLAGWDLGDQPFELTNEVPIGTNMAFRRKVFEKYGLFRSDLGPNPANLIRGEDLEFSHRIMAQGERLCYQPSAIVYHPVLENRLSRKYFLAWYFDMGRSLAREHRKPEGSRDWLGVPRFHYRGFAKRVFAWMLAVGSKRRFFRKLMAWEKAGQIAELYHLSVQAQRAGVVIGEADGNHSHSVHI